MISENDLYQIILLGEIDRSRIDWFQKLGFTVSESTAADGPTTVLTGQVIDQSHLRGLLNKIWDLNFKVVQVNKLGPGKKLGEQDHE